MTIMENEIFYCDTGNTVTLYWDMPKDRTTETVYTVYLDDEVVGTTKRTHYTIEQLIPDTDYRFKIMADDTLLGNCCPHTACMRKRIDVTSCGVVGDGKTMNTEALQSVIDACGSDEELYFPAGEYLTGALRLHSEMAIYLEEGAVLQGTDKPEDYLPRIRSRFEGTEMMCYSSLLNLGELDHDSGPNCHDVLIYGKGTIASGGQVLALRIIESERELLKDYLAANQDLVSTCENDSTIPGRVRPRLINLSNCRDVRITGLTLKNGASWNVHMIYCDGIVTDHCTFVSEGVWNGDGWDPDSSANCTLFASRFYTEDDSVAIKSGKNPEGNVINRPSSHIRVFDCYSDCGHGICMGSEMSGGIEDVRIWDCDLSRSLNGIEIKGTKKRGGYVRDIQVQDCVLPRLMIHTVGYNDDGIPAEHPPVFERCSFERLKITGRAQNHREQWSWSDVAPIELAGFEEPGYELREITFRDCTLTGKDQTVHLSNCKNITFENICCED